MKLGFGKVRKAADLKEGTIVLIEVTVYNKAP